MRFLLLIVLSLPVLADNHSKSEKGVLEKTAICSLL